MRLAEDCFHESYSSTVGVEFKSKVFDVTTKSGATRHPKLQVWDFAGCGKFAEIAKKRYEEAHAICFVYDCTAQDSFDEIESHWVKQVKANNDRHQHTVKCLVGNKSDLTDKVCVCACVIYFSIFDANCKYLLFIMEYWIFFDSCSELWRRARLRRLQRAMRCICLKPVQRLPTTWRNCSEISPLG